MARTTEDWMNAIKALLEKAASTESPGEKTALEAKAFELAAKWEIDLARATTGEKRKKEEVKNHLYEAPYPHKQLQNLAATVYLTYGCDVVFIGDKIVHLFGFAENMELGLMLHTSVLNQGAVLFKADNNPRKKTHYAQYRRAWWEAFDYGLGRRLIWIHDRVVVHESGKPGTMLAIRTRDEEVKAAVATAYPNLRKGRKRRMPGEEEGYLSGYDASQKVDLGHTHLAGERKGIDG